MSSKELGSRNQELRELENTVLTGPRRRSLLLWLRASERDESRRGHNCDPGSQAYPPRAVGRIYRRTCGSKRTAQIYAQLAKARPVLEANAQSSAPLSIEGALRFLRKQNGTSGTSRTNKTIKPDLLIAWNKATPEELTRHLDVVTVVGLLRIVSLTFRRELEARLRKEKTEGEPEPHYKLTMALRTAIGCVKIADDPQTSHAVALSQEKAAPGALRGLARMHVESTGCRSDSAKPRTRSATPKAIKALSRCVSIFGHPARRDRLGDTAGRGGAVPIAETIGKPR